MFEEEDDLQPVSELIDRFEQMLEQEEIWFFDVEEFESIADFYFSLASIPQALKAVNCGLQQHPSCRDLLLRKTQYLIASNRLSAAWEILSQLRASEPDSFELAMALAGFYSRKKQHHKAIAQYHSALELAEYPEDVYNFLAREYQTTGNYEQAAHYFGMMLEMDPFNQYAANNLALCFEVLNQPEEGVKFFNRIVDLEPYSEGAWYQLGMMQVQLKEYDEAIRAFDFAILADEEYVSAYIEKGRAYERTYRLKEAIETYEQCMDEAFFGPDSYCFYKMAICYHKLHQAEKAEVYFTKAVISNSGLHEAWYELALMKDEQDKGSEAVYFINQALELEPNDEDYLFIAADIHRRAGLLNEAEVIYEKLLELGNSDPHLYIDYAELLFDLCEFDNGMQVLYRGVELNPDSAEIHYRLSGYLYTLTEYDEACIYFKRGCELEPARSVFFFELFPELKNAKQLKAIQHRVTSR